MKKEEYTDEKYIGVNKERLEIKIMAELKDVMKMDCDMNGKTMTDIIEDMLYLRYMGYEWETSYIKVYYGMMGMFKDVNKLEKFLVGRLEEVRELKEKYNDEDNNKK